MQAILDYINERIVVEDRGHSTPCWVWQMSPDAYGYAQAMILGKVRKVHRFSYEAFVGPIPEGLMVDHLCRVRNCVNPAHLEPVTNIENLQRSPIWGKRWTHCKRGHEFSGDNVTIDARGSQRCRACRREDYLRDREVILTRSKERAAARKLGGGGVKAGDGINHKVTPCLSAGSERGGL